MKWDVVYKACLKDEGYVQELEAAIKEDRSPHIPKEALLFPERLTAEFLGSALRVMGSFKFANQYMNQVIPSGAQSFKKEWIRYYEKLPEKRHTFAFIDPAISLSNDADFTAVVVVDVDIDGTWYLRLASRYRITPTEIVNKVFELQEQFSPLVIGIEDVAYQKALLYMTSEEMIRRNVIVPLKGIRPDTEKSKEVRILGLVPRFEWARIFISRGLYDFESEYSQYVGERSAHDDLLDALAYIEQIAFKPSKEKVSYDNLGPNHPDYEKHYIQQLQSRIEQEQSSGSYEDTGD